MPTQSSDPYFQTRIKELYDSRVCHCAEFYRDAYIGPHLYLASVDRYQTHAAYLVLLRSYSTYGRYVGLLQTITAGSERSRVSWFHARDSCCIVVDDSSILLVHAMIILVKRATFRLMWPGNASSHGTAATSSRAWHDSLRPHSFTILH
jgi:hypothetical protein